jgi:hypothetical protein
MLLNKFSWMIEHIVYIMKPALPISIKHSNNGILNQNWGCFLNFLIYFILADDISQLHLSAVNVCLLLSIYCGTDDQLFVIVIDQKNLFHSYGKNLHNAFKMIVKHLSLGAQTPQKTFVFSSHWQHLVKQFDETFVTWDLSLSPELICSML